MAPWAAGARFRCAPMRRARLSARRCWRLKSRCSVLGKVQHGRVLRLTLNRPEKRNALNRALCQAILEAVEDATHDPTVGAILLEANGKSFCAGMDLEEAAEGATEETNVLHERLFTVGSRTSKPVIAAVRGPALGGGTG